MFEKIYELPLADNVFGVSFRAEDAMREYGLMKLRYRALYRAAFENRLVRAFLRFLPGLPELLLLGLAEYPEGLGQRGLLAGEDPLGRRATLAGQSDRDSSPVSCRTAAS